MEWQNVYSYNTVRNGRMDDKSLLQREDEDSRRTRARRSERETTKNVMEKAPRRDER